MDNSRCTTLVRYISMVGQIVRSYFSATGGMVTFFAPYNEAFERIPEYIERRLLRDRIWLEKVSLQALDIFSIFQICIILREVYNTVMIVLNVLLFYICISSYFIKLKFR